MHLALIQEGVHSDMAVNLRREHGLPARGNYVKSLSKGPFAAVRSFALRAFEYLAVKLLVKPVKVPFSLPFLGRNIQRRKLLKQADIIHLHWISQGFLTPGSIRRLRKLKVPLVWTMHDSAAFTGGCHVRHGCENFKQSCGNCPFLKRTGEADLSHYFWKKKKTAYENSNITVVAPSDWMAGTVRESSLLKDKPLEVIPNAIDARLFTPREKEETRQKLGWPPEVFMILAGYMPSKVDLHKGSSYLLECLGLLARMTDPSAIKLAVFGSSGPSGDLPFEVFPLGHIHDDEYLAACYAAADVFLNTSLEDNLPNTVMESLSSGTPVVSFRTGGIPDMVLHEENGYLADRHSAEDAARGLYWVMRHPQRQQLGETARKHVLQNFSSEVVARKHIELYESLLKGNKRVLCV